MSKVKKINEGVVTSLPDTSYVVACDANGSLSPIKVADLFAAIRDSIKVGGRNLIEKSDTPHSGSYVLGALQLTESWKSNKQYILTLEGVVIGEGHQAHIQIWDKDGMKHLFSCYKTDDEGVYRGKFDTQGLSEVRNGSFSMHNFPNGLSTITSFTRAKFEEGNIPTAWSPAPEDLLSNSGGVKRFPLTTYAISQKGGLRNGRSKGNYQRLPEVDNDRCYSGKRCCSSNKYGRHNRAWHLSCIGISRVDWVSSCTKQVWDITALKHGNICILTNLSLDGWRNVVSHKMGWPKMGRLAEYSHNLARKEVAA